MTSSHKCPNCQSQSLMRVRRTRMDKLNRVQAKYRCQNCHESFSVRKSKLFTFDDVLLKIGKVLHR